MEKKKLFCIYTILFAFFCACSFCWFVMAGKSFIWSAGAAVDGSSQHYTSLVYYGEYLREIISNLFMKHRLDFPMWDPSIGLGGDVITTLNYYVMGDPLTLLSVFVPAEYTEYLYAFLIILRLYLAGITFILFCEWFDFDRYAVLVGALVYVFAQYAYFWAVRHPFFINPMIYLPLLLLGIEKIYAKESPVFFILSVAVAAASNFYFFYMLCIFMFLYAAFRYVMLLGRIRIKILLKWFFQFLAYFLVGLSCAGILFLPNAINILSSSRMGVEQVVPLLYGADYYQRLAGSFTGSSVGASGYLGYSALIIPAVYLLFVRKYRDTALKAAFLLLLGFLCIPYIGHVLNGFSYVSNRWSWAMGFLLALIVVKELPEFLTMNKRCWRGYLAVVLVYGMLVAGFAVSRTKVNLAGLITLAVCTGVLWILQQREDFKKLFMPGCILVVFVGILLGSCFCYSQWGDNYSAQFLDRGTGYDVISESPGSLLKDTEHANLVRYDTLNIGRGEGNYNSAMLQKCNGVPFYFSSTNSLITQYFNEMYLNTSSEHCYGSLNGRGILDALSGCQYMATFADSKTALPLGFSKKVAENGQFAMYYSDLSMPMSYTYDSVINRKKYERMSVNEKQEAMLQGAVVEEAVPLPETELNFISRDLDYKILSSDGVRLEDGKIIVDDKGSSITLKFDGLANSETYVIFEGLDYDGSDEDRVRIRISDGIDKMDLSYHTKYYSRYTNKHNFLVNMGYSEDACEKVCITFYEGGTYQLKGLRITCQPMSDFGKNTEARKSDRLENIQWGCNTLNGRISLVQPKMLCVTVPYSQGWSVIVDGEETKLYQLNTVYSGIYLEAGEHEILMKYRTPYILEGVCLSLTGILLTLMLVLYRKFHDNRFSQRKFHKVV